MKVLKTHSGEKRDEVMVVSSVSSVSFLHRIAVEGSEALEVEVRWVQLVAVVVVLKVVRRHPEQAIKVRP